MWRELGWTRFMGSTVPGRDASGEIRAAVQAMETAAGLRPADARLQLESGSVALAAYAAKVEGVGESSWQGAFERALQLEPALAAQVTDLMVMQLGARGAQLLDSVLPPDSRSRLAAASFLIGQGHRDSGMALYRDAMRMQPVEADALWNEYRANGRWLDGKGKAAELLRRTATLDPGHPGIRLMRGQMLAALQAMERRGEPMGKWWSTRTLTARLTRDLEAGKGDPVAASYCLGLLAEEEGDRETAIRWFNRTLSLQGQHFPAWLHLHALLREKARSDADRIQLAALEAKIRFFAMDEVVPDAWRGAGVRDGRPAWRAAARLAEPVRHVAIRFASGEGGVWALAVDGRFLAIWENRGENRGTATLFPNNTESLILKNRGTAMGGEKDEGVAASVPEKGSSAVEGKGASPLVAKTLEAAIPAGEHEFTLTTWNPAPPPGAKGLPFRLSLSWK
jgi:tetratricopeptide (TPR) repeat protein